MLAAALNGVGFRDPKRDATTDVSTDMDVLRRSAVHAVVLIELTMCRFSHLFVPACERISQLVPGASRVPLDVDREVRA